MTAWSEEEIRFLKDNIGNFTIGTISRKLNKPEDACVKKASELKIGSFKTQTDMFTVTDAAVQIGCSRSTVERYIKQGRIKPIKRTVRNKTSMYFLKYDDVIDFANQYSSKKFQPWSEQETISLKRLLNNGYSYKTIGSILGRSKYSVEHKARDMREKQKAVRRIKECL